MRSKNKSSLNIQSLKIDQLPIKRILLLVILSYLLMAFGLFFLTVYRMLVIPYAFNLVCSDVGLALLELCANEVIRIALYGPEWSFGPERASIMTSLAKSSNRAKPTPRHTRIKTYVLTRINI